MNDKDRADYLGTVLAEHDQIMARHAAERDEARAEAERLRGIAAWRGTLLLEIHAVECAALQQPPPTECNCRAPREI